MKTKILLAGLAFFAFTTIGVAQGTAKKAVGSAKTECATANKACCQTAKADKASAAKTATTSKKVVAQPAVKK